MRGGNYASPLRIHRHDNRGLRLVPVHTRGRSRFATALYLRKVELLLNLIWLALSLLLASWWIRAVRRGRARKDWTAAVTVCLLLMLLFPVISMTDDLVAMTSPSEIVHEVRRGEMSLAHSVTVDLCTALACAIFLFAGMAWLTSQMVRLRPYSTSLRLLSGFFRTTTGVRPPPVTI